MFAARGINLPKRESRPSRAATWAYLFWADSTPTGRSAGAAALEELASVITMVRVFGTYPEGGSLSPKGRRAAAGAFVTGERQAVAESPQNCANWSELALTAPNLSARLTIRDVRDRGLIGRSLEGTLEREMNVLDPTLAKGQTGIGE